uniref:hypothetical protein n=1 Tax=uncultured Sphingomonas sp. TaxID=158754 RepID=UPI0035CA9E4A
MSDRDLHPDSLPENDTDPRSDIEQAVEARKDAVERGEGGREPDSFTAPGEFDGVGGTGGVVKNQDDDAQ